MDHPSLGEGTPQEILDQALHSFLIAGLQAHALVDAGKQAAGWRLEAADSLLRTKRTEQPVQHLGRLRRPRAQIALRCIGEKAQTMSEPKLIFNLSR